ncbi:hypothetical protein BDW68DRAFT_119201 [Aspergillus falconensis]
MIDENLRGVNTPTSRMGCRIDCSIDLVAPAGLAIDAFFPAILQIDTGSGRRPGDLCVGLGGCPMKLHSTESMPMTGEFVVARRSRVQSTPETSTQVSVVIEGRRSFWGLGRWSSKAAKDKLCFRHHHSPGLQLPCATPRYLGSNLWVLELTPRGRYGEFRRRGILRGISRGFHGEFGEDMKIRWASACRSHICHR